MHELFLPTAPAAPAAPTLQDLSNELDSVENWHLLGVKLGLEGHQLRGIEQNYHNNNRCKNEMLDLWQRNAKAVCWETVVKALCMMKEQAVADKIQRKYCSVSTGNCKYPFVEVLVKSSM